MTVYAVRAKMVDGSMSDLLLFLEERDALQHREYLVQNCRLLGYDSLQVAPRRVIGRNEPVDRRRNPVRRRTAPTKGKKR